MRKNILPLSEGIFTGAGFHGPASIISRLNDTFAKAVAADRQTVSAPFPIW